MKVFKQAKTSEKLECNQNTILVFTELKCSRTKK